MVSIITPFYNAEEFIRDAIESVVNQDYENWELILVNDGSTDSSKQIALSFTDKRIKYFEQENKGVSEARSYGLSIMQGDFFCFLDADDILAEQSLSSRIKVFEDEPKAHFVDGKVIITSRKIREVIKVWRPKYNRINPQKLLVRLNSGVFVTISWMFRRNKGRVYRFDEKMTHAEDLWFFIQNSQHGLYCSTDAPILHFRRTGFSAMSDINGLESGYLQLLRNLKERKSEFNYNSIDLLVTRCKILKIMFLSFLAQKKYAQAINAIIKFLKA